MGRGSLVCLCDVRVLAGHGCNLHNDRMIRPVWAKLTIYERISGPKDFPARVYGGDMSAVAFDVYDVLVSRSSYDSGLD